MVVYFVTILLAFCSQVELQPMLPHILIPSESTSNGELYPRNSGGYFRTIGEPYWIGTASNWLPLNNRFLNYSGYGSGTAGMNLVNSGLCAPGCSQCTVCFATNSGTCGSNCMGCNGSGCANQQPFMMPNLGPNSFGPMTNIEQIPFIGPMNNIPGPVSVVQRPLSMMMGQGLGSSCISGCGPCTVCIPTGMCYE